MILAGLIDLAKSDCARLPSLSDAVAEYCNYQLRKDQYRTRYAETIGANWDELDPGFFQYAVADAIACYDLYCRSTAVAKQLTDAAECQRPFGFLTESIQVRAAISLAAITRNGMHVDLTRAAALRDEIDAKIERAIAELETHDRNIFHRYKKDDSIRRNKNTGWPKMNMAVLANRLEAAAQSVDVIPPKTKSGMITTSTKEFWNQHRALHPLVESYCQYKELTKVRTFMENLNQPVIHPSYRVFVRTGRTSCSGPNIQQLPRGSHVREVITASPGHILLAIDFAAVELVTLAAV